MTRTLEPSRTASTQVTDRAALPPILESRRQTAGLRIGDLLTLLGALVGAIALTGFLASQLVPIHGFLAFFLVAYVLFVAIYSLLVWLDEPGPVVLDRVVAILVQSGAFLLVVTLASVLLYTVFKGASAVWHPNFFTQDLTVTGSKDPLTTGGVMHAIVGTLTQITIALLVTIPLGVTTALFLTEVPGPFSRFVRTIVEAMTALPSIVAGLFILATLILVLGFDKSGFAAGLAITVMMLPIMIRAADVVFRLVPGTLKEASLGLGASQFRTVMDVVLPTSRSGLMTAIILATARGIGETSPVLLTAGYTASLNKNPFSGPMVSLPLVVFQLVKSPEPTMVARGFGTAVVLMLLVLILFVLARVVGAQDVAKKAARKQRRAALVARLSSLRVSIPAATGATAMRNRTIAVLLALAVIALGLLGLGAAPSLADGSYTPITGEGSSWAANAIDDWRARNANTYKVNFAATGSVAGLTGYANGSDDFAASDIPFGVKDTSPDVPGRAFAYLPDVAGGTALMYNLSVGGKQFTNLKLSGESIAGIFEGTIKMWNDPKIAADNPGVALPPLKITPVVRSDGSGSTAQFTLWMEKQFPSIWTCGELSFFTQCNKYDPTVHQAKSGDNGVAGFVAQAGNAGSIGYVEYSYALQSGYPVAKVLNKAGFYVLPTASNVAVALLKAQINTNASDPTNYLTQVLDGVYTDTDPRTYPISSYSYFVIPTQQQNGFTTDKGKTLSTFAYYALCQGQQQAPTLGYSPLPINLVQAGLQQIAKIPGAAVQNINIKNCNNPTFSTDGTNTLAKNALYPDLCDKKGAAATCAYGTPSNGKQSASTAGQTDHNAVGAKNTAGSTTPTAGTGGATVSAPPGGGAAPVTGTDPAAAGAGAATGGSGTSTGGQVTILNPDGKTSCDPDTGQCTQLAATPVQLAASHTGIATWVVWLLIAAVLLLIFGPALMVLSTRRRA